MENQQEQMSLFEAQFDKPKLPKHIRLIEIFAGIGAQAKGLEIIGADFEHWRTCEWSWQSIKAYNAIHIHETASTAHLSYEEVLDRLEGVSNDYNKPMTRKELLKKGEEWARDLLGSMIANHNYYPNVSKLSAKDLAIDDRENNTYILTYSFPCQDLSSAGTLKGMEKGEGTRSGLLWEIERILNECKELDCLPQVLIMENVPAILFKKNLKPFNDWLTALEGLGYTNYYKVLNGKDFLIPQNRARCFMVSLLGNYSFSFPRKMKPRYCANDFTSKGVNQWYYLSDKMIEQFYRYNETHNNNGFHFKPTNGNGAVNAILAKEGTHKNSNYLIETDELGDLSAPLEHYEK